MLEDTRGWYLIYQNAVLTQEVLVSLFLEEGARDKGGKADASTT